MNVDTINKQSETHKTKEAGEQVVSCLLEESTIIKAPIGKIWEALKEFN